MGSCCSKQELEELRNSHAKIRRQMDKNRQESAAKDEEIRKIKQDLEAARSQLEEKTGQNQKLQAEINTMETNLQATQKGSSEKDEEIKKMKQELEETRRQLEDKTDQNQRTGTKLTDNKSNIASISDINRPSKLAKKFSQLYEREWSDAYEVVKTLEKYRDESDKTIIKVLFDTMTIAYQMALEKATSEIEKIKEEMNDTEGNENETEDKIKQLKYRRKAERVLPDDDLKQKYQSKLRNMFPHIPCDNPEYDHWNRYHDACLNIAWLMAIQDPPIYLECGDQSCKSGDNHDRSKYKEYSKPGDMVDFPVWPAMYIQQGGLILQTGVAQCKSRHSTSLRGRYWMRGQTKEKK